MNLSRVRVFSVIALLFGLASAAASAQDRVPNLWFQGTRLILDHPVPTGGDIAVATRDSGMRRFLDRLGATVAYQPQQRYLVVTAQDHRTIVFTVGDPTYSVAGVRARAAFAPFLDGGDVVLPFYALARALYVEPVASADETVLQPRVGALDVRSDGPRTVVTVRAAMPLVTTTVTETPDRLQLSFAGLGSSLAPDRRSPGPTVDGITVAAGGTPRVPTTTLTITGTRGTTHHVIPTDAPGTYQVVFENGGAPVAYGPPTPPPPVSAGPTSPDGSVTAAVPSPSVAPTAVPPVVAGRASVTDFTVEPGADDALAVRITLSAATSYTWHRLADHRWYLDFPNTTLTGPGRTERPTFGGVQSVRIAQMGNTDVPTVRVAFTMSGDQRVDLAPSDSGLTIAVANVETSDLARSGAGRTGGAPLVASEATAEPYPAPRETPWKYGAGNASRTIVLDPGHGGGDTGAVHNGLTEKILTMDIAQRLRALLVAQGWTVKMTRDTDIDPVSSDNIARMRGDGKPNPDDRAYLQTRCDTANAINARLFISIHVNSAPVASARGTTFYWYKPQDAAFAQALERAVIPTAGTQDDGARHENFYVVRHTTMPAVLIETAFLTNPDDVTLLRSPDFLQNIAQGIANGVRAYTASQPSSPVSER